VALLPAVFVILTPQTL